MSEVSTETSSLAIKKTAMTRDLGSGKEYRVIDLANRVNVLAGNEAGIKYIERRDWDVKSNF